LTYGVTEAAPLQENLPPQLSTGLIWSFTAEKRGHHDSQSLVMHLSGVIFQNLQQGARTSFDAISTSGYVVKRFSKPG
jgi:hypothetical protein